MSEDIRQQTPESTESQAAAVLAPCWHQAEMGDPNYPIGTASVLALLEGLEYRADGDLLLGMIDRGVIPVPMIAGRRQWSASHVLQALNQCEGRRRWRWPSALHGHKFSQVERAQAEAEASGHPSAFHDADRFDVESLLVLMVSTEQMAVRDAIRVCILGKLRAGEGVH